MPRGVRRFQESPQPTLSPEQKRVWSREEEYWQILKALDREGYIALWDKNFVGWPYPLPDPIRKDAIRLNPFGLLKGRELKKVELKPKAVQVFDDVAVVLYIVKGTYAERDGSIEVESLRITHIWRKSNGIWLIISGMSAPAEAPESIFLRPG